MADFILQNLPVFLCFIFGMGLLTLEVFMPGFGLPGIVGIILEAAAIILTYRLHGSLAAPIVLLIGLCIIAVVISLALRSAKKGKLSKSDLILTNEETAERGYTATQELEYFVGKKGVAKTPLRPAGMVDFDGVKLSVVSDGEYIPKDSQVVVDHVDGVRVVVRLMKDA
jgi:membrane-bound ClpP family serine protease